MNINEVSKKIDVSKDTLRYWERIGLLPKIERNSSGYRNYSKKDINWVFYIKVLRKAGMSIELLIDFVKSYRDNNGDPESRKELLMEQKQKLIDEINERQKTLNYLSFKIDHFKEHTLNYENEKLAYENKIDNEKEK
ncbi:MerR family transcriptional regulator [Apilactobacillus timberlakei]|uniref:MerR family transcriptional regulator n=1 Tax=Apilactobacillus timberlakei TaxID=2008380 RepID=A0ABY2YR31_9LACO|nr:MerR family transcriptional regulator [Apilactobacillus timberlakei]TPR12306.1 MerR family transcriptional regulator [Apilactobacillus timberlakei]TPR12909.1 MerR family transcriptional regulator [Apilactobacillus timberlakei]